MSRPGVATTTAGLLRSPASCGAIDSPPMTTTVSMPRAPPSVAKASAIWSASSRVGASTSADGPERPSLAGFPARRSPVPVRSSIIGIANAAVLPVPV